MGKTGKEPPAGFFIMVSKNKIKMPCALSSSKYSGKDQQD
jgi:hypothetical protein